MTTATQSGGRVRAWSAGAALVWLCAGWSTLVLDGQVFPSPPMSSALADPESRAIAELLREYRDAFAALDVDRVAVIWPGVDRKSLGRAFGRLEQQFIVFERCEVTMDAPSARARCTGNARVVPRVGGRSAQYRSGEWQFTFAQKGESWQIRGVEATVRPSVR